MFSFATEFGLMHRLQWSRTSHNDKNLYLYKRAVVKAAFAEGFVAANK